MPAVYVMNIAADVACGISKRCTKCMRADTGMCDMAHVWSGVAHTIQVLFAKQMHNSIHVCFVFVYVHKVTVVQMQIHTHRSL